jgi:hypothetical protein
MKFLFCLFALAAPAFGAISFSLPGTTESASWTLTSAVHPGFNSFGTAANPWASAVAPDAGTAVAGFGKTGGSGYIGGSYLYTAGTVSSFSVAGTSSIGSLETIVFQGNISALFDSIVLNYNGGSQALPASFYTEAASTPYADRAWQWDLSKLPGVTRYEILFSGHVAVPSLSVTAGSSFVQAIPEPSAALLGAAALGFTLIRRRRA